MHNSNYLINLWNGSNVYLFFLSCALFVGNDVANNMKVDPPPLENARCVADRLPELCHTRLTMLRTPRRCERPSPIF